MIFQTPEDQAICAWYDSQSEEFLSTLPGYEDGLTPRQAWAAFIADCTPPATQGAACAVAAPAAPALGVCTSNDMLRGELSHPIGFWFTCHGLLAFLPSDVVRSERRA